MAGQVHLVLCQFLYRNTIGSFPANTFSSIGTMLKETYVNVVRSQCNELNIQIVLYKHIDSDQLTREIKYWIHVAFRVDSINTSNDIFPKSQFIY